jgi:hypothetical protein
MRKFAYLFGFLAVFALVVGFASHAATTGQVLATVTVQNISLTVSDGSVAYGTLGQNTPQDTTASGVNDTQLAVNTGNIASDFTVKGANTTNWTLAGTTGSDQYKHDWCTVDCDGTPTWNSLTTSYATLSTGVAALATTSVDFRITTPNPSTVFTQQTASVSVQVTAQ